MSLVIPEGKSGDWRVERFTVSLKDADFENLRASIGSSSRGIGAGTYTRLMHGGTVVMSDTPAEVSDLAGLIHGAKGRVLLAGLGLGVALGRVLDKPEVQHVTVVERSPDVVRLVWPAVLERYGTERTALVEADVTTWRPPRGARWDVAWLDIWDDICGDNAAEMKRLRSVWRRRAAWVGCWAYYETLRHAWPGSPGRLAP